MAGNWTAVWASPRWSSTKDRTAGAVTDQRAELIAALRRLAAARGLVPEVGAYRGDGLDIAPHPVVHTSHPT